MLTQVDVANSSYRWGLKAEWHRVEQGIGQGIERELNKAHGEAACCPTTARAMDEQTIADKTGLSLEEVRQLTLH